MHDLPFVDAHVHLWDLDRIAYPWLTPPFDDDGPNGSVAAIARTYLLDDYRREAGAWNPVGMVHVDAGADPARALDETDWLQAMAEARGMPNAIVAFAALDDPGVAALLAAHAERPAVRGIRHIVNWHPEARRSYTARDVTGDADWQRGYALLANHGLSFDLQAYPGQFATLFPLLSRHPDIPVILNHAGMATESLSEWRDGLRLLAALPHVSVKLSGFGFSVRPWDAGTVRDRVRTVIDIFGTDRAMFASDFPTDRLFAPYGIVLATYARAVEDFPIADQRALFAGNANRIYRLGLDL